MAIEKEVAIQLKVVRPKDGMAFNDAARQAKELDKAVEKVGGVSTKALSEASASAKRFAAETAKGKDAVTGLMREIARGSREAKGIDSLTDRLKAFGVESTKARAAATQLMKSVGDGARVADADLRRLANTMRATGGGGGGRGGFMGRMGGFFNQPISGISVGMGGAMALGARAFGNASNALTQSLSTTADAEIAAMLGNRQMGGGAGSSTLGSIHTGIPVFSQFRDWMTSDQRQGAAESVGRGQGQRTALDRMRQRNIAESQARISRGATTTGVFNAAELADADAYGGRLTAQERVAAYGANRRFEQIGMMQAREFEAAGRGEGIGRGSLDTLRREMATPQSFGGAARNQLETERRNAQRELAAAETTRQQAEGAGVGGNEAQRTVAAEQLRAVRERMVEIERRDVELTRAAAEAEQQRLERFRQFAQAAEEGYRRIAQAERDRISNFREQFGLMNEIDRANTVNLARRAQGGGIQNLSGEELGQLRTTGLFDQQIRGEAIRRAEMSGVQGVIQASGAEGRAREAEARQAEAAQVRIQLDNQITNNITVSADQTARQIADQVLPALQRFMQAQLAQIQERLDNQLNANAVANQPTS